MNLYEMNIESIKKNRSFMYKLLKDADRSTTSNRLNVIKSVDTKDNEKAVVIKYQENEYRLNSIYRPVDEAKRWVEQFKFQNLHNLVTIYGLGNGTFARAIIEKMGKDDTLVIYEPCADIFFHVINNYDITDILAHPRVSLSVEKINEFEFHNTLRGVINIKNISDQIMCIHPQYDKIFPESCIFFWKELKESYFNARININTEIYFGKRFIDNILNNVKYLHNSYTLLELKDILPMGIPAMIIAAGPSVGRQIEEIKRAKGKAIIFAVDRILEFLLDSGVEPDYIVTLDPMKPVKYFTKRTDVEIPLICFQEANHEILDIHKGKKIICNCSTLLDKIYRDANKIPPRTPSSASVATLTFSVCVELGFKDIILVGQDLAYDGEQSHAGNEEEHYGREKDIMLEDVHGNLIRSRYDWKEFVIWFQDMLTLLPDLNVIDAKEKGAKIKGTKIMPLKEALDTYCIDQFKGDSLLKADNKTFSKTDIIKVKEHLKSSLLSLNKIKTKSKESIKYCDVLIKDYKKNSISDNVIQDLIKKLSKNNSYIEKQHIYHLMDKFVVATSAQYLMELGHITEDEMENNLNTYEKAKSIFEAVIDAADYIKPRLKEAIEQVIPADE